MGRWTQERAPRNPRNPGRHSRRAAATTRERRSALLALTIALGVTVPSARGDDVVVHAGESIQSAIDQAQDGDRILVDPGTYLEALDLGGKALEVIGIAGAGATVIDATGLDDSAFFIESLAPISVTIRGFTITGGAGHTYGNSYGGGVLANGAGIDLTLADCVIDGNGSTSLFFAGGVYVCCGARAIVSGCQITNNSAYYSGGGALADGSAFIDFDRCTIADNWSSSAFGTQGGIAMANSSEVVVRNSVLWSNSGSEIESYGGAAGGNVATVSFSDVDGGFAGTGVFSADPMFVDVQVGDYHLQPCSPCVDAGDPTSPPDPDGSVADAGSYPLMAGGPTLGSATSSISLSAGGTQGFCLSTDPSFGLHLYLVLGSGSGSDPGTIVDGLLLPLNVDDYTVSTLASANTPVYEATLGFLDSSGRATAALNVPPGTNPTLAGLTLHHAYVVVDLFDTGSIVLASNAVPVLLEP